MMQFVRILSAKLPTLSLLTLLVVGCGPAAPSGDVLDTVPAGGVLTYQGKPLAHHQVLLYPQAAGGRPAAGTSDAEGKFVLGTNTTDDGAVVGTHQVAVLYVGPPNANPEAGMNDFSAPPPPDVKIPEKYMDGKTSGLTVEIPSGGNSSLSIELQ